ncbi:MAG: lysine--tRNA ligase [Bdellovibrionota bacterium]
MTEEKLVDSAEQADEQTRVRREKLEQLRQKGKAYPHFVKSTHSAAEVFAKWGEEKDPETLKAAGNLSLGGRCVFIRSFGKAGFVKLLSRGHNIQLYVAKDSVSIEDFEMYQNVDLGDQVWAEGHLFRTKTGELSLHATKFVITSKCLHTPPEKFHGLTDIEERYRKRYVDLFSNEDSRKTFQVRSKVNHAIREFFHARDYIEVETPMMHPLVSGAAARPFSTHHNTLDRKLFLRIAPELYLKRLVVGGFERVFEMNRNFRNEGVSPRHNPEFTMLEFYEAYSTYTDLMDLTEELMSKIAKDVTGSCEVEYQGQKLNFGSPWKRMTMEQAIKEYSSYKGSLGDAGEIAKYLSSKGIELTGREGLGALFNKIFEEEVDRKLIQPTFITGYPVEISPLARRSEEKSETGLDLTDRFELFINGIEVANGFNELNDPDDQKKRFLDQLKEKEAGNVEACDYDEDYIRALEYAMPPTAGEGIGIDRFVMLLTNSPSIRDVILFPQMRD